jgi:hypothetical protein
MKPAGLDQADANARSVERPRDRDSGRTGAYYAQIRFNFGTLKYLSGIDNHQFFSSPDAGRALATRAMSAQAFSRLNGLVVENAFPVIKRGSAAVKIAFHMSTRGQIA